MYKMSRRISTDEIMECVAEAFGINKSNLKLNTREVWICRPRQMSMYFMRHYTNLTCKDIAKIFGFKNHTTVLHADERIGNIKQKDNADLFKLFWKADNNIESVIYRNGYIDTYTP